MQIKVMADYGCAPLWWDEGSPEKMGDIQPDSLGLSDGLCADLWAWSKDYDATLNVDDPSRSGFRSSADEQAFEERGRQLTERLAGELEPEAKVRYWRGDQ
ncbi:hypothetical protein [Sphingobium yanoikuyae]|uniref:hypothetical protein n=1 Tax=Sphingobium yanoikuyae TaxID=13690 RepID=UPI0035C6B264